MADWSDGYVTTTEYTSHFYSYLAPAAQNLALLLAGFNPVDIDADFTYCELGCGQGYTTAVLAATNPRGRFWGVDFNPTHIAGAAKIKAAAGLGNVEFIEKSFAELTATPELPSFDYIALHGVWSWISPANRAAIVAFIYAKLKPGGVVYVSYNALPGWASAAPLRQLLVDSQRHKADIDGAAVDESIGLAKRMQALGANYFKANPAAAANLDQLSKMRKNYLIHEYFNRDWRPSYFSEVAADLKDAKLGFACSSDIVEHIDQICITPEAQTLLKEQPDAIARETVRDFFRNPRFRRDLFTRGARRLSMAERVAALENLRLALAAPPPAFPLQMNVPVGSLNIPAEPGARIVALLAERPMSIRELLADPQLAAQGQQTLFQVLLLLVTQGSVQPALSPKSAEEGAAAAARFNRAMLFQPVALEAQTLASPLLGSGLHVPRGDQFLMALERGGTPVTGERLLAEATRLGMTLQAHDKSGPVPITTPESAQTMVDDYHRLRLPVYRSLGS